jgi:hypothetical protein
MADHLALSVDDARDFLVADLLVVQQAAAHLLQAARLVLVLIRAHDLRVVDVRQEAVIAVVLPRLTPLLEQHGELEARVLHDDRLAGRDRLDELPDLLRRSRS